MAIGHEMQLLQETFIVKQNSYKVKLWSETIINFGQKFGQRGNSEMLLFVETEGMCKGAYISQSFLVWVS